MTVKLTPEEVTQCENFARQVSEAKKGSYGSTFLANFTLGIKGELAYAKIFNLKTNFAIYEGKKGDGGTDFDGVITHFDDYENMSKLPALKKDLVHFLTINKIQG